LLDASFISMLKKIIITLFAIVATSGQMFASEEETHHEGDFIMHHVKDSHEWTIAKIGSANLSIHLPIIILSPDKGLEIFSSRYFFDLNHHSKSHSGYYLDTNDNIISKNKNRAFIDLSVTKNVASLFIGAMLMLGLFLYVAVKYKSKPSFTPRGMVALLEMIILFVKKDIVIPNIGETSASRFMPYLLSIFFFIWINNLLGLLPAAANLTGNISVTLVLAVFTFLVTNFNANKSYWKHIFRTPGVPLWLSPIMIPVELLGVFTKPISLIIRLFANITAGHIILLSIINIIFILKSPYVGFLSVPFGAFMFMLKLLVAFLQAYIFTLLSAIYIGAAVESHH